MKIILLADVEDLGRIGDAVTVADGYARNFLVPKKLAIQATERSLKQLNHQKKIADVARRKATSTAESIKRKIETLEISIQAKAGEDEKLYGSVTSRDIHKVLVENEVEVDRRRIILEEPIRQIGVFEVPIQLGYEVTATAKVWVVAKES